jgi:hypothetical protein
MQYYKKDLLPDRLCHQNRPGRPATIFNTTSQERAQMVDALNNLKNSIESQRMSNERLSGELHYLVKSLESRVERMEESVKEVGKK